MGNCLGNERDTDSLLMCGEDGDRQFVLGQDQSLIQQQEVWTSEVALTEGALQGKRDTFWETAPVYEGRQEIWDALRAACEAMNEEDYELAQAILEGANIILPRGRLIESYDELGNRYLIPKYCISKPSNMTTVHLESDDIEEVDSTTKLLQGTLATTSPARKPSSSGDIRRRLPQATGPTMVVKVRLSTLPKDTKITIFETARVKDLKRKLAADHNVDARKLTMFYSGRVLNNGVLIKDLDIPKGFVIQAVVM